MSEQQQERAGRTSIGISWPVRDRLAELTRQLNAKEHTDRSAGETVEWLTDVADAADLP